MTYNTTKGRHETVKPKSMSIAFLTEIHQSLNTKPKVGMILNPTRYPNYLEINVGEVPGQGSGESFRWLLTRNPWNANDPPLRTQKSEVVEVKLFGPGSIPLLGLLEKPFLHLFSPIGGGFALSPLVSELSSFSGCKRSGIGWIKAYRDDSGTFSCGYWEMKGGQRWSVVWRIT